VLVVCSIRRRLGSLRNFRCTQLVDRWPDSRLLCPLMPSDGLNCSSELQSNWRLIQSTVDVVTCFLVLDHITSSPEFSQSERSINRKAMIIARFGVVTRV